MAARDDAVVITGVGAVTAFGAGHEPLWSAMETGAVKRTHLSELCGVPVEGVRVGEWDRAALLGNRGLQYLRPSTQYLCGAAVLALRNAGFNDHMPPADDLGVVISTNLAGLDSIAGYDWTTITEGPQCCSPMEAPNTLANAPASHLAIRVQARALNTTISSGQCGGLDAMGYAMMALRQGRARYILLGGVEELNQRVLHLYANMGVLPRERPEAAGRPFDPESSGWLPGEGAAVLVLEFRSSAEARGAQVLAELAGWHNAMVFPDSPDAMDSGLRRTIVGALDAARSGPERINLVVAGASGLYRQDVAESNALRATLGEARADLRVCSVKDILGETYGAAGVFQAMAGIAALTRGIIPVPAGRLQPAVPAAGLDGAERPEPLGPSADVLLTALDMFGSASAIVLRSVQGGF